MSGQPAADKPVRPAALCRGATTENRKAGWSEETELNGVEEERHEMSDEERNEIDGEEELAAPHWRARAGPRIKPTQREREEHEATRVPFRDWCVHCMMGRGRTIIMLLCRRVKISPDGLSSPWITSSLEWNQPRMFKQFQKKL